MKHPPSSTWKLSSGRKAYNWIHPNNPLFWTFLPIKATEMVLNCIFAQFKNFPVQNCANCTVRVDNWVGSRARNHQGGIE